MFGSEDRTIVLVGQPNSGKSTLFNVMADKNVSTSNYAGTSDEISITDINVYGDTYHLVDLPGTYSLNPTLSSEEVTFNYLLNHRVDLIINVVDASLLTRSLELTVELTEVGLPMVVALNMIDEAESHGLDIDVLKLSEKLNVPVVPMKAIYGKGVKELADACFDAINYYNRIPSIFRYTSHVEKDIGEVTGIVAQSMDGMRGSERFYAIKALENPRSVPKLFSDKLEQQRDKFNSENMENHGIDIFETISYERHHLAMKLSEEISVFRKTRKRPLIDKIDEYLLRPFTGSVFLALFFLLYFLTIFLAGNFLSSLIEPPIAMLARTFAPLKTESPFIWYSLNGAYLGFSGVLGIVLPYFLPLVLLTSLFEETGYLARVAFLIDGIMHKIGLHGKSVVPFILGFGCSVPALYATRLIENRRDRIVTALLIPFIPCSARIAVIFALTAAFTGPLWAMIVFLYIILIIALSGKVLSKVISRPIGLILDIPALKVPSLRISMKKTWIKTSDFLKEAMIFLVLGSIVLGWIEYFKVADYINIAFRPVLTSVLGLPDKLGSTLIFGFFRKELIIVMANQSLGVASLSALPLTTHQVIVFIIFVALYFPCFTTFIVLIKEYGTKIAIYASAFCAVIATISGFLFKIFLSL